MTTEELLEVVNEPFEAFRLVTTDGTVYDITDPRWFRVGTRTCYIFIPSLKYPEAIDYQVRVANSHISQTIPLGTVLEHQQQDDQ